MTHGRLVTAQPWLIAHVSMTAAPAVCAVRDNKKQKTEQTFIGRHHNKSAAASSVCAVRDNKKQKTEQTCIGRYHNKSASAPSASSVRDNKNRKLRKHVLDATTIKTPLCPPRPLCETTKIYLERIKLGIIKIKYLW